jgi:hypothetical protein
MLINSNYGKYNMNKDKNKTNDVEKSVKLDVTKKDEEKASTSFDISSIEMSEFKKWKKEQAEEAANVTVSMSSGDKVYDMWKEESKIVKGIFRCRDPEGGTITFNFLKYKWDKTQKYTMSDGEVYEIPLAVARHLNNNCSYAVHSHILGADGNPSLDKNKVKSRMNFEGLEFSVA